MDLRTGCPFWVIKNGLLHSYPALDAPVHAEVAVIGAGVTGAAVAYQLARHGVNVVVLDRRDVASGSTAASTGLLQYELDTSLQELASTVGIEAGVRAYRLGLEAIDHIEAICAEVGDPCGFARRSSLYVASSPADADELADEHALRTEHGFDVDLLAAAEVKSRFGFEAPGALLSAGDGEVDPFRFSHALLNGAASAGARVYDRTNVSAIHHASDGVVLDTAAGPQVHARRVVCATGYETTEHLTPSMTELNSTWACASEPVGPSRGWEGKCLIWETARPYFYLRTTDDGRVLLGGEDSRFATRHQNPRLLSKKTRRLTDRFAQWFPEVAIEVAYSWAGVFANTRDGLPCVGAMPERPHIWYALGYGGNGITFGVMAARLVCDAWLDRPNADAALFRFDRATVLT
jgi:glycine/D-amino acid oxidase-like deaminating enzyme